MGKSSGLRISHADILSGDLLISFSDGKVAVFPALLLHEMLPQLKEVFEETMDEAEILSPSSD